MWIDFCVNIYTNVLHTYTAD